MLSGSGAVGGGKDDADRKGELEVVVVTACGIKIWERLQELKPK